MQPDQDHFALAGSAASGQRQPEEVDTAQEVFPVTFEKDDLDFRGIPIEEEPVVPKASSAPASVRTPTSVTGLEDVSSDDLETSAQENAEKVTNLRLASGS